MKNGFCSHSWYFGGCDNAPSNGAAIPAADLRESVSLHRTSGGDSLCSELGATMSIIGLISIQSKKSLLLKHSFYSLILMVSFIL